MPRQKYVVNNSIGIKNKGFERDTNDDECAYNDKENVLRRRTDNKNADIEEDTAERKIKLGKEEEGVKLRRELGLFSAIALIIGTMIGSGISSRLNNQIIEIKLKLIKHSGIFVSPGGVLKRTGSDRLVLD